MSKATELIEKITKKDWGFFVSIYSKAIGKSVVVESPEVYKDHGGNFRFKLDQKKFSKFEDLLYDADDMKVTFKADTAAGVKVSGEGRISDGSLIVSKSDKKKDLLKYIDSGVFIK